MNERDQAIKHFGILGMKWGKRKSLKSLYETKRKRANLKVSKYEKKIMGTENKKEKISSKIEKNISDKTKSKITKAIKNISLDIKYKAVESKSRKYKRRAATNKKLSDLMSKRINKIDEIDTKIANVIKETWSKIKGR